MAAPEPSKNTWLRSAGSSGSNYGGNTTMWVGSMWSHGSESIGNIVLEFDFSSSVYDDVPAILKANLRLFHVFSSGSVSNTVTISRLGIDFVEDNPDGCNWTDTGAISGGEVTWNGGVDYKMTDVPQQSFLINDTAVPEDIEIDVLDFVRDAILRRGGIVRLLLSVETSGLTANNYTRFGTTYHTSSNPNMFITIADRIIWDGATGDGDADNHDNWVGGSKPTTSDYAMFTSGSVSVTSGEIECHSLFIGDQYTGELIHSNGDPIQVSSTTVNTLVPARVINKNAGIFNLLELVDVNAKVDILNAPDGSTYALDTGSADVHVGGTRGRLELAGDTRPIITGRSRTVTLTGADTNANIVNSAVIAEGCDSFVLHNARWKNESGTLCSQVSPSSVISGRSSVHNLSGDDIDGNIYIYGGRLHFTDNPNVAINDGGTGEVTLWKGGIYDTRTGGTNQLADTVISTHGGNFVAGAGTSVTISTT